MRTLDLTIGVTSFNDAHVLGLLLASIEQTVQGRAFELLAIDNCSTDESATLLRKAGATVWLVQCRQAEALNELLARARGEYRHASPNFLFRRAELLARARGEYRLEAQAKLLVLASYWRARAGSTSCFCTRMWYSCRHNGSTSAVVTHRVPACSYRPKTSVWARVSGAGTVAGCLSLPSSSSGETALSKCDLSAGPPAALRGRYGSSGGCGSSTSGAPT